MHPMKVFLVLGLIMGVAVSKISSERIQLQGDELTAAKELLTGNLDKLPGHKLNVVNWLSTEGSSVSGSLHEYIVDVFDGSKQNECTFRIWQTSSTIKIFRNEIYMICQGGKQLNQHW